MKSSIFISVSLILTPLIISLIHYYRFNFDRYYSNVSNYSSLTRLVSPAYSSSWYEPRIRRFEQSINPSSPQLLPFDRFDFIYGDLYVKQSISTLFGSIYLWREESAYRYGFAIYTYTLSTLICAVYLIFYADYTKKGYAT